MAVTGIKKQEQVAKNQQPVQAAHPYTALAGVSQNTANNLGNYQAGYQAGQQVNQAQNVWNQIQAQKPGQYQSKYSGMLDNIMAQINNPQEFKYEFNGDNLFKGYADLYNQYAKQGMMDAMGKAAALTGGYGNSYAQAVGQQQYQQNMLPLYDKGLELYDRAYQGYRDRQNDNYNRYNLLAAADQTDYGRYRDQVGDWQQEEQTAYGRYQDAQNMDYQQYQDMLNYWTGLAQIENADFRSEQERQEAIRQWQAQFDESKRRYDQEWQHQLELEAAAAAAAEAAAAGGGNGGGGGNVYYTNGRYYKENGANGVREIPESEALNGKYTLRTERNDYTGRGADADAAAKNTINKMLEAAKKLKGN